MADEANSWNDLAASFPIKRINHQKHTAKMALARTARRTFSAGYAAPRSAIIIIFPGFTLGAMPPSPLGATTIGR